MPDATETARSSPSQDLPTLELPPTTPTAAVVQRSRTSHWEHRAADRWHAPERWATVWSWPQVLARGDHIAGTGGGVRSLAACCSAARAKRSIARRLPRLIWSPERRRRSAGANVGERAAMFKSKRRSHRGTAGAARRNARIGGYFAGDQRAVRVLRSNEHRGTQKGKSVALIGLGWRLSSVRHEL